MANSVFPAPAAASNIKQTFTATSANTLYTASGISLASGTYTVTCPSAAVSYVDFYSGLTLLTSATTASGTVDVNLASAATMIKYWSNTASTSISFLLTGNPITTSASGTLDTITATTNTYAGAGSAGYVVSVGGGGGGGGGGLSSNNQASGGGGGAGACAIGYISSLPNTITVGAAGNAGNYPLGAGGAGGTTTCGTIVSNGGNGGPTSSGGQTGGSSGGTTNNTGGVNGAGGGSCPGAYSAGNAGGTTAQTSYTHVKLGTNGAGGAGGGPGAAGGGSGIGTGGTGGNTAPNSGGAGSGYGAGGGGGGSGGNNGGNGGAGSAGVVYIVRFNS